MSILNPSHDANRSLQARFRSSRRTRPDLVCESLEQRQLLSADAAVTSSNQATAQPSLDVIPLVSSGPTGYSPEQIQTAYGVNQIKFSGGTVSGDGAGQTIAIVDAYNDPTIASDLAKFDSEYGLSAPPSFEVKNLGATSTNASWALETSLDVEWAHAIAPDANIVLVEAASSNLNSLFNAVSYASKLSGVSVVSMSWGTEEFWGESSYNSLFTTPAGHTGVTYVASSGDSGAWYGPMYPSVSPNVLAVGGTELTLNSNGTVASETGWNGSTGGFSGTDMGFWSYEAAPSYQVAAQESVGLSFGVRTTPDVSFNADPNTGVAVYDSVSYSGQSGWFDVGGTSAAAPAWAGLVAITDQGLALAGKGTLTSTQTLKDLYSLPSSDFNDITTGYNGYSATPGYDLVTGLGSPKSNLLVAGLLAANGVSSTSVTTTNTPAVTSHSSFNTSHHFALLSATDSGSSSTTSTLTTAVATTASTSASQLVGVLPTQITDATTTGTTAPNSSQSSTVATATTSSSSSLGQSIVQKATTIAPATEDESQPIERLDAVEPASPSVTPATDSPAKDQTPVPEVTAPDDAKPVTSPNVPPGPRQPIPETEPSLIDAALETIGDDWSAKRARLAPEPRVVEAEQPLDSQPESGSSSIVGTAAVAAAGLYWFRLQKSDRRQSRWIPGRI